MYISFSFLLFLFLSYLFLFFLFFYLAEAKGDRLTSSSSSPPPSLSLSRLSFSSSHFSEVRFLCPGETRNAESLERAAWASGVPLLPQELMECGTDPGGEQSALSISGRSSSSLSSSGNFFHLNKKFSLSLKQL